MSDQDFSELYNKYVKGLVFYASVKMGFDADRVNTVTKNAFTILKDAMRVGQVIESPVQFLRNSVDSQINNIGNAFNPNNSPAQGQPYTQEFAANEVIGLVKGCIEQMPDDMRFVMTHIFYKNNEVSVEDIAALLDVEPARYYELCNEGISKVSEVIKKQAEDRR